MHVDYRQFCNDIIFKMDNLSYKLLWTQFLEFWPILTNSYSIRNLFLLFSLSPSSPSLSLIPITLLCNLSIQKFKPLEKHLPNFLNTYFYKWTGIFVQKLTTWRISLHLQDNVLYVCTCIMYIHIHTLYTYIRTSHGRDTSWELTP